MNKKMLEKFKKTLLEEREKVSRIIKQTSNKDIDFDGDEVDEIQGNLIVSIQNQLIARDAFKLNKIDAALKRINDKSFGSCEDCGEEIAEKRLNLNPYSLTCISCAEEREIKSGR